MSEGEREREREREREKYMYVLNAECMTSAQLATDSALH